MAKKTYLAKIRYNKRTGHASVCLQKKKLALLKKKKAKYLKIKEDDLI
jgi:hypothetical protein